MLENSLYKLKNNDSFTVGYFGGSITEGAGASTYDNCWAGKTTAWLGKSFPDCSIRHIQAAVGGTGSSLGAFRCDTDLTAYKPDLVFYEFAVNDGNGNYHEIADNCESILRKIWAAVPDADIVMIYTITQSMYNTMKAGNIYSSRAAQAAVAYHYGNILQIDIGMVLADRIISEGGDWKKYTCDTVHPNDAGYQIYFDTIRKAMSDAFGTVKYSDNTRPVCLPAPMYGENQSSFNAHMTDCSEASYDGSWKLVNESLCGRYPRYLEATVPGAELTFVFYGRCLGFYWMMAKDSGDILCSVDGGPEISVRSWDTYCKGFNRGCSAVLPQKYPEGRHTAVIRVSSEKAPESEGHAIRIGAFLVK